MLTPEAKKLASSGILVPLNGYNVLIICMLNPEAKKLASFKR
jgi:hypothetical protein